MSAAVHDDAFVALVCFELAHRNVQRWTKIAEGLQGDADDLLARLEDACAEITRWAALAEESARAVARAA